MHAQNAYGAELMSGLFILGASFQDGRLGVDVTLGVVKNATGGKEADPRSQPRWKTSR